MFKRFIALFLAVGMCLSFGTTVLSAENTNNDLVTQAVTMILQGIATEPEGYGLKSFDFENMALGARLPAYRLDGETVEEITDIEYYPLMSGSRATAIVTVVYDEDNIPVAQISTGFAAEMYHEAESDAIALVFCDGNVSVWNGVSLTELNSTAAWKGENYAVYNNIDLNGVERQYITPEVSLTLEHIPQTKAAPVTINVPQVKQNAKDSCWAACITSIAGYYGITTTIDRVYDIAGVVKYKGASVYDIFDTLSEPPFELEPEYYLSRATSCMSYGTIQSFVGSGRPLVGCINYPPDEDGRIKGHALVIRGYYLYTNSTSYAGSISYMNPYSGYYEASNVKKSGSRPYIYTDSSGAELGKIENFVAIGKFK